MNQQRQVVEEVFEYGRPYQVRSGGRFEAGAARRAGHRRQRDAHHLQRLQGRRIHRDGRCWRKKIGRQIIPVVEKYTELDLILKHSAARGRAARHRPAHQAGQPRLGTLEIVRRLPLEVRPDRHRSAARAGATEGARAWRIASSCCISIWAARSPTSARSRRAVIEAARIYVELKRAGAGLQYLDVGGGLGIDYDGSQTDFESSVNYTLQEYANDVVYHIQNVCDEAEVPHPDHRFRKRTRHRRVSQRAGVQRSGRDRLRRRRSARRRFPTMPSSR